MKKKELHFVMCVLGGSGKTVVSAQLADARNALVLDMNPVHQDIGAFVGLNKLPDTNLLFTDSVGGGHDGNYQSYTEEIIHSLIAYFMKPDASSVVVDMDGVSAVYMLKYVISSETFREMFEEVGVLIYYHLIVSSLDARKSLFLASPFYPNGKVSKRENSVVVWFNSFSKPFVGDEVSRAKMVLTENIGGRLCGFADIGDEAEIIKGTVSRFFKKTVFSEFEKNVPVDCDKLRLSRIRQFDQRFKAKISGLLDDRVLEPKIKIDHPVPHGLEKSYTDEPKSSIVTNTKTESGSAEEEFSYE